jgi:hypothetical protein
MAHDRLGAGGEETGLLRNGAGNRKPEKQSRKPERTKARKKNRRLLVLYDSFDGQGASIEVEEESNLQSGCPEVGLELHKVNVSKAFNSLQLQNDLMGHHQVNSGSAHHFTLKAPIHRKLRLERHRTMG